MKFFQVALLVSTILAAVAGVASPALAIPGKVLIYDTTEFGKREIKVDYLGGHQITSSPGTSIARNPCWTRIHYGDVSGCSVGYETDRSGDFGIYQTSWTEYPSFTLSTPVALVDWAGSNETDPDWIPTSFKTYVPGSSTWSTTDPGQLVFVSDATGTKQIYTKIGGIITQVTFSRGNKTNPTWARQGDSIIYESGGTLYEIPAGGGTATVVASGDQASGDPNDTSTGGVSKSINAACSFVYTTGGYVATQPSIYGDSAVVNTQPTADFDGQYFAYTANRQTSPTTLIHAIIAWPRVTSSPPITPSVSWAYDESNPDVIGLYTEPKDGGVILL